MSETIPKVTVWIPSYNHGLYLAKTIESVLGQSLQDFELLIVDDGSTDNSLEIARSFEARHPDKIRVETHPGRGNRGVSATANLAHSLARGRYWCGLPSDDVLPHDSLRLRADFLDLHPECDFVYGRAFEFDHERPDVGKEWGNDVTLLAEPCEAFFCWNPVPGMTVMARRACWLGTGPHDETIDYSDWQFWYRMFAQFRGHFIPEVLARQRNHGRNYSLNSDLRKLWRYTRDLYLSLDSILNRVTPQLDTPRNRAKIALQIAVYCYGVGDLAAATRHVVRALGIDGSLLLDRAFMEIWFNLGFKSWISGDPGTPLDFIIWFQSVLEDSDRSRAREGRIIGLIEDITLRAMSEPTWGGDRNFRYFHMFASRDLLYPHFYALISMTSSAASMRELLRVDWWYLLGLPSAALFRRSWRGIGFRIFFRYNAISLRRFILSLFNPRSDLL